MPNTDTAYFYTRIIEAFVLAERLLMPEVCNAMLAYLHYTAPAGLLHCHGFIYSNTVLGSPLRSMLLDMLMNESRFGDFCDMSADYGANSEPFPDRSLFFAWFVDLEYVRDAGRETV